MSQQTWNIDPYHSEVQFKVKHLVISTVTGNFQKFEGSFSNSAEDFSDAEIKFSADIASISTNNGQRDEHLKSDDFFNAEKFPKMSFQSTKFEKLSDSEYRLTGDLTIRDVTQSVTLAVEYGGKMQDPYGNLKAGFEVTGKISRKSFGLNWHAVTEAGGVVVGDEVKIIANVQFAQVKEEATV